MIDNYRCIICNNTNISKLITRKVGGQIIECAICGHLVLWPILSDQEVLAQYKYSEQVTSRQIGTALFDNMAFKLLKRSDPRKNINVLDIGCGLGEFMHLCTKEKLDVVGIEITESIVDQMNNIGFEVYLKSLSEYSKSGQRFDWVSCLNLIEHVNNPMETIAQLVKLVKPNGRLVIQTPNGSAIVKHVENAYGLHVDKEHLNYFIPDQLVRLFVQHGFELVYKKYYPTNIKFGRVKMPKAHINQDATNEKGGNIGVYRSQSNPSGIRFIIRKLPPVLRSIIRTSAQIIRYFGSIDEIITGTAHEFIIVMKKKND